MYFNRSVTEPTSEKIDSWSWLRPVLVWGAVAAMDCGAGCLATAAAADKPPAGFTSLLADGELKHWKTNANLAKHWTLKEGVLTYDGQGEREGGTDDALNLVTRKDYQNFELWVDWKIAPLSDSGIYLRGCPQVQIWDVRKYPEGSGGLYNNEQHPRRPRKAADKPAGQWNTFKIRMVGDKVTVRLNGVLIVDGVTMENYFDRSRPIPSHGPIGLQHHRSRVSFRNIYVKELPSVPTPDQR